MSHIQELHHCIEVHPLILLERTFRLLEPTPYAKCCGDPRDTYQFDELAKVLKEGAQAHCRICGKLLMIWLEPAWWELPAFRTNYYARHEILKILWNNPTLYTPEELDLDLFPSPVLASIRFHFGTVRKAYAAIGRKYTLPEVANWKERVAEFLGEIPDAVIARQLGVSKSAVARLRRKNGIPAVSGYQRLSRDGELRTKASGLDTGALSSPMPTILDSLAIPVSLSFALP